MQPQIQLSSETSDLILAKIIENESRGLLADLSLQPTLIIPFMGISEEEYDKCLNYIAKILITCYQRGEMKLIVNSDGVSLNGYALFFQHPDPAFADYCHKIFVYESERKKGIGSALISQLLDFSPNLSLLCSPELIPFYEKAGMQFGGYFEVPAHSDDFRLTKNMYQGLAVLNSTGDSGPAPIFMLNNNDANHLLSLIGQ